VTGTLVFEGDGRVTSIPVDTRTAAATAVIDRERVVEKAAPPAKGSRKGRQTEEISQSRATRAERNNGEIEKLEAERTALAKKLEDPALYQKSHDILRTVRDEMAALEKTIHDRYVRWEELESLRTSLSANTPATSPISPRRFRRTAVGGVVVEMPRDHEFVRLHSSMMA